MTQIRNRDFFGMTYVPCIDAPVISIVFNFSVGNFFDWALLVHKPRRYCNRQIGAHNIEKTV